MKEIESLEKERAQQEKSFSHKVVLHDFWPFPTELLVHCPLTPMKPVQHGIGRWNVVLHDILRNTTGARTKTRGMSCGTTFYPSTRHFSRQQYIYRVYALGQGGFLFFTRRRTKPRTNRRRTADEHKQVDSINFH